MTVFFLVMHLIMADGSVKSAKAELEFPNIEACLDYGKKQLNDWHEIEPDSTSGMHFCILKEDG
jgi:hypothetical protein